MKCPFYNSHTACTTHPDCLFLRNGGCAIVLAPQIAEQNQREIKSLQSKLKAGNGYASTSFQTAWAMLGLMAAGEVDSPEVRRGAGYLICTQKANGL